MPAVMNSIFGSPKFENMQIGIGTDVPRMEAIRKALPSECLHQKIVSEAEFVPFPKPCNRRRFRFEPDAPRVGAPKRIRFVDGDRFSGQHHSATGSQDVLELADQPLPVAGVMETFVKQDHIEFSAGIEPKGLEVWGQVQTQVLGLLAHRFTERLVYIDRVDLASHPRESHRILRETGTELEHPCPWNDAGMLYDLPHRYEMIASRSGWSAIQARTINRVDVRFTADFMFGWIIWSLHVDHGAPNAIHLRDIGVRKWIEVDIEPARKRQKFPAPPVERRSGHTPCLLPISAALIDVRPVHVAVLIGIGPFADSERVDLSAGYDRIKLCAGRKRLQFLRLYAGLDYAGLDYAGLDYGGLCFAARQEHRQQPAQRCSHPKM